MGVDFEKQCSPPVRAAKRGFERDYSGKFSESEKTASRPALHAAFPSFSSAKSAKHRRPMGAFDPEETFELSTCNSPLRGIEQIF
jgi:hypothetical protein